MNNVKYGPLTKSFKQAGNTEFEILSINPNKTGNKS